MEMLITKKILDKYNISPNQLWLLHTAIKEKADRRFITSEEFKELEKEGFIKYDTELSVISVRSLGENVFKVEDTNVKDWIQEYRNIFKGIKPGSMGDSIACLVKMDKFLKVYHEYNKETILEAAKLYIDSLDDFRFIQRADYFISKADVDRVKESRLASFCEEVKEGNTSSSSPNIKFL
jgi:hypothetical protein